MRVGERVADALVSAGLRHLFGLLASSNLRVVQRVVEAHGLPYLNARHEAVALGMADGYARATGRVGFCAVTQGPGLTSAVTALVTAARARSPVVLLACDSSGMDPVRFPFSAVVQRLEAPALLDALGIAWLRLDEDSIESGIASAAARAAREPQPVTVLLPTELQHQPTALPDVAPPPPAARPVLAPAVADLRAAAETLATAQRPVVLAGAGAVEAGAREALVALAGHAGALLATTLRAAGWFSGLDHDAGICGGFSRPAAAALLAEADCVVAFGASLNHLTTRKATLFRRARVVQVDTSAQAFGRFTPPAVTVLGDARLAAEGLLDELTALTGPRTGLRTRATARALAADRAAAVADGEPDAADRVDPRALCRRLDALLPAQRTVVTDSGYSFLFPVESMSVPGPDGLLFMADFGAVGCGLGAAMGAAVGRPDRAAVLLVGDGGLIMTLGDLDTAARYRVPLLVVCMNDQAYGAEIIQAREHGLSETLPVYRTGPLADVARTLGVPARTVTRLEQLDDVPDLLAGMDGPYLLDCRTATVRSAVHDWV